MFMRIHPYLGKTNHECSELAYVDEEHKLECNLQFEKNFETISDQTEDHQFTCRCPLISLIFRFKNKPIYKVFTDNVIFKMFQSLRFKILLGLAYVSNYDSLLEDKSNDNGYIHLGVQILTIPEISVRIIENKNLREIMMKKLKEYSSGEKGIESRRMFFWIINDFKYLMKKDAIKSMLKNHVVEEFIDHFQTLCMSDKVKMRDSHIYYQTEGYFFDGLDYQYLTLKILFNIIKEVDYTDLKYTRKLANLFYDKIIKLKEWWIQESDKTGYISIPLLRAFSMFLSKYLMINYIIIEEDQNQGKIDLKCPKEIISSLISQLFNKLKKKEIEHLFDISVKVNSRALGFLHEINSDKWVNYGYEISALPKLLSNDLSFYFIYPDFVLTQLLFIFSSNPKLLLKSFIEGYSIDQSIERIFTNMIFSPDEYKHNSNAITKDISNLKNFLYLIISLLSNDRCLLHLWRPHKQIITYNEAQSKIIEKKADSVFERIMKYEAIHNLIKCSGSNIKTIYSKTFKHIKESEEFEKQLNIHAKISKNREGKMHFSLDPKYLAYFNIYYYQNMQDQSEGQRNYDEFYKAQYEKISPAAKAKSDPLSLSNISHDFIISLLRESFLKTDLISMLINMLKYKSNFEFVDKEVEEFSVKILTMLIVHSIHLKSINSMDESVIYLSEVLSQDSAFFEEIKTNPLYNTLSQSYLEFIGKDLTQTIEQQQKVEEDKKKELDNKKEKLKRRKELAMQKLNDKRNKVIKKCGIDTETSSNNDSISYSSEQEMLEIPKCQNCFEDLSSESFKYRPYGYLSCVTKTKLYYDSLKQTYYELKENDLRANENEILESHIQQLEFNEKAVEQLKFLSDDRTGVVIRSCKHLIHYDCLNKYKEQNMRNRMRVMMIEDFDINEFPCPLCKYYSNTLIPPEKELEDLINDESIEILNESSKGSLEFLLIDVINMIKIKSKANTEKDKICSILPKDLPKIREEIIGVYLCNYINHMIQMIDTKGLSWVLEEKSKIKTLMHIGVLLMKHEFNSKKEKFNLKTVKLFEENKMDKNLLEINISNLIVDTLIKYYFQTTHENKNIEFEKVSKLMKISYAFVLLQISAKIKYEESGFMIKNKSDKINMESLLSLIKTMDATITVSGQLIDISKRFVEGSLSFLRKMIASVLIIMESKSIESHAKIIKKLANRNFSTDPSKELSMLLELMGWNDKFDNKNFDFYSIIEQVKNIDSEKDELILCFKSYFDNHCGFNNMEISKESVDTQMEFEEEKIDTSVTKQKKNINPNMIPTWCYMITPDFYFTLPKLCKTLEEMTKKYYNKHCSLCDCISKRGAICLVCEEYICTAKCNLDANIRDYEIGNLTQHSQKCGGGSSIFIGPVEGQLIYIYNGLAVESKSPFIDKYGECFDEDEKKYGTYYLDDIHYNKIREDFLEFFIPNTVITKRASKTRVYRQNIL